MGVRVVKKEGERGADNDRKLSFKHSGFFYISTDRRQIEAHQFLSLYVGGPKSDLPLIIEKLREERKFNDISLIPHY